MLKPCPSFSSDLKAGRTDVMTALDSHIAEKSSLEAVTCRVVPGGGTIQIQMTMTWTDLLCDVIDSNIQVPGNR